MAVTLGVTYALKYSVNAERPNGGSQLDRVIWPRRATELIFIKQ